MAHITRIGAQLAVIAALAGACSRAEESRAAAGETGVTDSAAMAVSGGELQISNVMIGRQIGPGNRITEPTFQFAPQDTVYVSVGTEGGDGTGRLSAAWRSQSGEVLKQSVETVRPGGENTEFHLSQPKGLKPGTYKVILFLGDDSVDTKVFAVKK